MGEGQSKQEDGELVLVALEGEVVNLDKLVTLARECGFGKLLSALVKDLHRAQAEVVEIIAMAAADEPRATAARPQSKRAPNDDGLGEERFPTLRLSGVVGRKRTVTVDVDKQAM